MTARLLIAAFFLAFCAAIAGLISPWAMVVPLALLGAGFLVLLLGGRAPHWRRDV